ncbi:MAG: hypothetical protein QW738_05175 [Nitrososphaeria archaeon]
MVDGTAVKAFWISFGVVFMLTVKGGGFTVCILLPYGVCKDGLSYRVELVRKSFQCLVLESIFLDNEKREATLLIEKEID